MTGLAKFHLSKLHYLPFMVTKKPLSVSNGNLNRHLLPISM